MAQQKLDIYRNDNNILNDSFEQAVMNIHVKKEQYGYKLMIDGACSPQVIKDCSLLGVDGFILGTSALFGKDKSYKELMAELREL